MRYKKEPYDVIQNVDGYVYYKLLIDGVSHYDRFVEGLKKLPNEQRSLKKVLALMERFSPRFQLMENRFRQIKGVKRSDVYEFKDPQCVRVYVVLHRPNDLHRRRQHEERATADDRQDRKIIEGL